MSGRGRRTSIATTATASGRERSNGATVTTATATRRVATTSQQNQPTALPAAPVGHGFLQLTGGGAAITTREPNNDPLNATINATTGMLLSMRNMTEDEIGMSYRDIRIEEQVKQFCKSKLFHWLKFIASRSELGKLNGPHDIGNVVMNGLNITDEAMKPRWWLLYQDVVRKALDTQRSNCNMSIKSVMVGKKTFGVLRGFDHVMPFLICIVCFVSCQMQCVRI
jgi:hypothetical protein